MTHASPTEGLATPRRQQPPHRWVGTLTTTTPTERRGWQPRDDNNNSPTAGWERQRRRTHANPAKGMATPRRQRPPHRWVGTLTTTMPTERRGWQPRDDNNPPTGGWERQRRRTHPHH